MLQIQDFFCPVSSSSPQAEFCTNFTHAYDSSGCSSLCTAPSCDSCSSQLKCHFFSLSRTTPLKAPTPVTTTSSFVTPKHLEFILISGVRWACFILLPQCGEPVTLRPFAKYFTFSLCIWNATFIIYSMSMCIHVYLWTELFLWFVYFFSIAALITIELKYFHIW